MSEPLPFFIVDVFAERPYEGNPLAVVLPGGRELSSGRMQAVAREMNYSETTFVVGEERQRPRFRVRIFTPEEEIPFAGHPVLGTAFILRQERLGGRPDRLELDLPVGTVPVTFLPEAGRPDLLWMEQPQPRFGEALDPAPLAGALNLPPQEIDGRFPAQEVSTGLPFLIVPVRSLEGVRRCVLDRVRCDGLMAGRGAQGILVFAPQACEAGHDLHVRVFVPYLGIPEDPATGSGGGCLAAWLVRHRYYAGREGPGRSGGRIDLRAEQGYEIHRPSLLALRAEERDGGIRVSVGGRVFLTARGAILL